MKLDRNDAISRRDILKTGATAATWGVLGLGLPKILFSRSAFGAAPQVDPSLKKYDAVIQCYMTGGPSQTDTWDPKPGTKNNIFDTFALRDAQGTQARDIYGNPIELTVNLQKLGALVEQDPSIRLGIVRSMNHGIGAHPLAQGLMNCYWQSPVGTTNYPSTPAVWSYLLQNTVAPPATPSSGAPVGIPSCIILANNGALPNDAKGGKCPTALQVPDASAANAAVDMLTIPVSTRSGADAARYARRGSIRQAIEAAYNANHTTDNGVAAWSTAAAGGQAITAEARAASAFDLYGRLPGDPKVALLPGVDTGQAEGAQTSDLENLTLAQQLVLNGVPFVAMAIEGNDTHSNNRAGVRKNWANTVDPAFTQMAKNLKASGKRVLVTFIGDFGRTPNTVADGRDGRDHWPSGFSVGFLSINQPDFKN